MTLKARVESIEEVPEALREHYAEQDGVYVLQAEGMKTEEDVSKVQEALDKERKARRDAEKKAKELESNVPEDFDPEEWRRLKDSDVGDVDSKLEEQRKRLEERHRKELEKHQEEVQKRDQRINDLVARDGLRKAMDQAGIAEPYKPAVEAMYRDKVSVEEDGDSLGAFIDGKPVPDALSELANSETGKYYVAGSGNNGGGAPGGKDGGGKKLSDMSEQEMVDLYKKNPEEYRRLRDQEQ